MTDERGELHNLRRYKIIREKLAQSLLGCPMPTRKEIDFFVDYGISQIEKDEKITMSEVDGRDMGVLSATNLETGETKYF